jgi:hypothetical protein
METQLEVAYIIKVKYAVSSLHKLGPGDLWGSILLRAKVQINYGNAIVFDNSCQLQFDSISVSWEYYLYSIAGWI